ncbi:MAG: alanine--glyoxylate aminotransferase family protein, partial [Thermoflexus sp.]|uniref:pyridoxal-phosphate-dependent aminotransferase family protein n=1 Tax=Thermoflexus sp. TaxID=1969742 RepID=UPI003325029E
MADRTLLMIPGPVEVDPEVLEAMARPPVSHMSAGFAAQMREALEGLREIFDAPDGQPFLVAGSGTLAMEMALANLIEPGDRVVVVDTGYFAARMAEMAEWFEAQVVRVTAAPGALPDDAQIEEALQSGARLLTLTHVDTSTGVAIPVARWAALAHRYGALVVVDGVCAIGGQRFHQTAWGVDVALTGSQKALAVPPGLAIVMARPAALEAYHRRRTRPRVYYADWGKWLPVMEAFQAGRPAYFATPAVHLVAAMAASVRRIRVEGMEARWARHERIARSFRAGLQAME